MPKVMALRFVEVPSSMRISDGDFFAGVNGSSGVSGKIGFAAGGGGDGAEGAGMVSNSSSAMTGGADSTDVDTVSFACVAS